MLFQYLIETFVESLFIFSVITICCIVFFGIPFLLFYYVNQWLGVFVLFFMLIWFLWMTMNPPF